MQIGTTLAGLVPKVNLEMNGQLDMPFIEEEISTSLSQMCPTKAPRPNGLPTAFFLKVLGLSKAWCHFYSRPYPR